MRGVLGREEITLHRRAFGAELTLAELERDPNRAEALRLGARDVVSYIAGHIDRPGARASFLNRPDVGRGLRLGICAGRGL